MWMESEQQLIFRPDLTLVSCYLVPPKYLCVILLCRKSLLTMIDFRWYGRTQRGLALESSSIKPNLSSRLLLFMTLQEIAEILKAMLKKKNQAQQKNKSQQQQVCLLKEPQL